MLNGSIPPCSIISLPMLSVTSLLSIHLEITTHICKWFLDASFQFYESWWTQSCIYFMVFIIKWRKFYCKIESLIVSNLAYFYIFVGLSPTFVPLPFPSIPHLFGYWKTLPSILWMMSQTHHFIYWCIEGYYTTFVDIVLWLKNPHNFWLVIHWRPLVMRV